MKVKNPIYDRQHLKEYLLFGLAAAVAYMIPVLIFLYQHKYENLYLLFMGSALFMFVIFYYAYRLLYRPYDGKRAVSMLIAGHLATAIGVFISCIFVVISFKFLFPDPFSAMPRDIVIEDAPATLQRQRPSGLLLMVLATALIANTGVGSFISIVTAYAGKRDQTKDKPIVLETNVTDSK